MKSSPPLSSDALASSPNMPPAPVTNDYFMMRDGEEFAGVHLLLDLAGAQNLDNKAVIEKALQQSAEAAGATVLHLHLHQFTPNGISGIAVLAESHISFHSWPDRKFAAMDVFMCGNTQPHKTIGIIKEAFQPTRMTVLEQLRGHEIFQQDADVQ